MLSREVYIPAKKGIFKIGMAIAAWGVVVGPPVFGYIVDATDSYSIAWGFIAVISLAATVMLRFLHEPKHESTAIVQ